jgi:hypothetical protein
MLAPSRIRRPSLRSQGGQSIVEFVLVLPFLKPGVDRAQLYRAMLGALPEGEGVAYNAIDVIRTSLQKASGDGEPAG